MNAILRCTALLPRNRWQIQIEPLLAPAPQHGTAPPSLSSAT
jgi:hypothetical protein